MKHLRDAMNVMTSMKEVYDTVRNGRPEVDLSEAEKAQLTNLKNTILQSMDEGDVAWSKMLDGTVTTDDSSVILSFVRSKNQIMEDLQ